MNTATDDQPVIRLNNGLDLPALGFGALLIGALGVLVVASARRTPGDSSSPGAYGAEVGVGSRLLLAEA